MRKVIRIVSFWVDVDILGFPNIITHKYEDYEVNHSQFFKAYSKK
jgi:hypothetical protein